MPFSVMHLVFLSFVETRLPKPTEPERLCITGKEY